MENHPRAENLAALKTKYVIKLRNLELDVYKIQQFYQKLLKIFKQSFSWFVHIITHVKQVSYNYNTSKNNFFLIIQ